MVMRWDAKLGLGNTSVLPAPDRSVAMVVNERQWAGWLLDTATGRKLRFFEPPIFKAKWNRDGSRLVVFHGAGGSGRTHWGTPRFEVFDAEGASVSGPIECSECESFSSRGVLWADGKIVTTAFVGGRTNLMILDPVGGESKTVDLPAPSLGWALVRPQGGDDVFAVRQFKRTTAGTPAARWGHDARVVPRGRGACRTAGRPDPARRGQRLLFPARTVAFRPQLAAPSAVGRGAGRRDRPGDGADADPAARRAAWMADDRLAWIEIGETKAELKLGTPGDALAIDSWRHRLPPGSYAGGSLLLEPSPDGRMLLVTRRAETGAGSVCRVYETEADRWYELPAAFQDRFAYFSIQWAGAHRLALIGQGSLALYDLEDPHGLEYVFGSPGS